MTLDIGAIWGFGCTAPPSRCNLIPSLLDCRLLGQPACMSWDADIVFRVVVIQERIRRVHRVVLARSAFLALIALDGVSLSGRHKTKMTLCQQAATVRLTRYGLLHLSGSVPGLAPPYTSRPFAMTAGLARLGFAREHLQATERVSELKRLDVACSAARRL